MDFAFDEHQEMLRSGVRDWLGDKYPSERVVELAESEEGWDPASWSEIAELGWLGLSAPEDSGGAGMGFLEEAVVFEELGRGLYPGPFFATVGLALPALAGDPALLSRVVGGAAATFAWAEPGGPYLLADLEGAGTKAADGSGGWTLTGEKILVPDLAAAEIVVVAASATQGIGLWAVERGNLAESETLDTLDATRRFGRLRLDGAPATLLTEPGSVRALEGLRRRALAALALEAVGVAQRVLDLTLAYAKERKQFDKPIGGYQAISHSVANLYVDLELARSLAYWAAWCVAEDDGSAPTAAATAKAFAGEAAVTACERGIQVHGGIGFTWEHVLHRYYKRAQWIDAFEGPAGTHRAAVAAELLDDR